MYAKHDFIITGTDHPALQVTYKESEAGFLMPHGNLLNPDKVYHPDTALTQVIHASCIQGFGECYVDDIESIQATEALWNTIFHVFCQHNMMESLLVKAGRLPDLYQRSVSERLFEFKTDNYGVIHVSFGDQERGELHRVDRIVFKADEKLSQFIPKTFPAYDMPFLEKDIAKLRCTAGMWYALCMVLFREPILESPYLWFRKTKP